jgi:hypothetical protein
MLISNGSEVLPETHLNLLPQREELASRKGHPL